MGLFEDMVQNMQRMEFFQYLFPFLLSFAILYGILGYVFANKLGGNRVIALISLILSFFVMLYSASNPWLYQFLTNISGVWLSIATFIIFVVVLLALTGINVHEMISGEQRPWVKWVILLILLYVIVSVLLGAWGGFGFGSWGPCLPFLTCDELWTIVFFLVMLGIVFWWIGGEKKEGGAGEEKKTK